MRILSINADGMIKGGATSAIPSTENALKKSPRDHF